MLVFAIYIVTQNSYDKYVHSMLYSNFKVFNKQFRPFYCIIPHDPMQSTGGISLVTGTKKSENFLKISDMCAFRSKYGTLRRLWFKSRSRHAHLHSSIVSNSTDSNCHHEANERRIHPKPSSPKLTDYHPRATDNS